MRNPTPTLLLPAFLVLAAGCRDAEVASGPDETPWMTVLAESLLEQVEEQSPSGLKPRTEPIVYMWVVDGLEEYERDLLLVQGAVPGEELPDDYYMDQIDPWLRGLPVGPIKWSLTLRAVTENTPTRKSAAFRLSWFMMSFHSVEVSASWDGSRWVVEKPMRDWALEGGRSYE